MEKGKHSKFVGGIHDAGKVPSSEESFFCKGKIAKSFYIRLFKREGIHSSEIAARKSAGNTLRKRHGVLDRKSHIRHAHLRLDASIFELDHAVNNALRMDQYLYLFRLKVEQPFCFDHLKPFIHQRG